MKLKDLTFSIPVPKPRDPNHEILATKKNAAGAHKDNKRELKAGEVKHRNKIDEEIL
jgi:hypothetical protein